mgnify:FL=1
MNRPCADNWPITLGYGYSPGYPNSTETHYGIDYGTPKGEGVWFREAGIITFAGLLGELGNYIQMQSDRDASLWWGLAHLSVIQRAIGQVAAAGEVVGLSGGVPGDYGAGLSTGAHLHEEARVGSQWGQRVDPDSIVLESTVDIARITEAMNLVWSVKAKLESHTPYYRSQRDKDALKLLEAVIATKEEAGLQ